MTSQQKRDARMVSGVKKAVGRQVAEPAIDDLQAELRRNDARLAAIEREITPLYGDSSPDSVSRFYALDAEEGRLHRRNMTLQRRLEIE